MWYPKFYSGVNDLICSRVSSSSTNPAILPSLYCYSHFEFPFVSIFIILLLFHTLFQAHLHLSQPPRRPILNLFYVVSVLLHTVLHPCVMWTFLSRSLTFLFISYHRFVISSIFSICVCYILISNPNLHPFFWGAGRGEEPTRAHAPFPLPFLSPQE